MIIQRRSSKTYITTFKHGLELRNDIRTDQGKATADPRFEQAGLRQFSHRPDDILVWIPLGPTSFLQR